jgi:hypothetical protein
MPSPFPGVDPYIEDQGYWPDFHASFVPYCRDALNAILPEPYEARLEEQIRLVEMPDLAARATRPDVAVIRHESGPTGPAAESSSGGVLLLEPTTIPLPTTWTEVRDVWIEIRRLPDRELITVIELLSPTNKDGSDHEEYRIKRRGLIRQRVHLVELDLLLSGRRLPMQRPLPTGDFYALVSRAERRPDSDVYTWTLRDCLPAIPIPLRAPDPDVMLDLASVFETAYERGRYARSLDYSKPLALPIDAEARAWAEQVAKPR